MADFKFSPASSEIFRHQSAVAVMRLVLATQQASTLDSFWIDFLFNFPFLHQFQKRGFIDTPVAFVLFVGIEDVLSGCEHRQVDVVDVGDFLEKVLEVVTLRKSGELGDVVETHIDDALGAALAQESEELGGGFFGEADGVDCGFRIHRSMGHPSQRRRFRVFRRRLFPRHVAGRLH